ncbi:MAG: porin family protein [Lentimicrobiaceae bacterium]|nr:porin family protein [Lentimicrobiaceae bacterium]
MKKPVLFLLFIGSAFLAQAQLVSSFTFGPKIGATFSKFNIQEEQIKDEFKTTFHYGVFVRMGESVYFQPELNVMTRNANLESNNQNGTIKMTSLDVPLLLGVRVINLELLNIRAMAGPVGSLTVNKKINVSDIDLDLKKGDLKNMNWGLQFGAGVDVLIFALDLRYEIGLNNVSTLNNFDFKNNMFTVALGIKLM